MNAISKVQRFKTDEEIPAGAVYLYSADGIEFVVSDPIEPYGVQAISDKHVTWHYFRVALPLNV